MTKFSVLAIVSNFGKVQHVVKARDKDAAEDRVKRAHSKQGVKVIEVRKA